MERSARTTTESPANAETLKQTSPMSVARKNVI
jgi:hypothetical protein